MSHLLVSVITKIWRFQLHFPPDVEFVSILKSAQFLKEIFEQKKFKRRKRRLELIR